MAISQAIVENWGLAQPLVDAVANHEDGTPEAAGDVTLTDVLCAANTLCRELEAESIEWFDFGASVSFRRVGLTPERYSQIMEESKDEIMAMMAALNG